MKMKQIFVVIAVTMTAFGVQPATAQDSTAPVIRIAELEIDPARMEAYSAAVKLEMETSIRVEPGVLALYAVAIKDKPNHLPSSKSMRTMLPTRRIVSLPISRPMSRPPRT